MQFLRNTRYFLLLLCLMLPAACGRPELPQLPGNLDGVPGLPGIGEIPGLLRDLGLPDLSEIPNLPQVGDLPALDVGPNAIAFAGPTERRINVGERIPGTDIELASITEEGAEFRIGGLLSLRVLGDSLDYDGSWTGASGVDYTLRLRLYRTGDRSVRVAGVQRIVINDIDPVRQSQSLSDDAIRIPYTDAAAPGETLHGLTFGYIGPGERGAELSGLDADRFPFRKVGDSIRWEGLLRSDIPARFDLRVLFYSESTLQVGGVVRLRLP